MLAEMTSAQLSEWMAYAQLEPWGEERADLRAGIIASTQANTMKGAKGKSFKPQDFMPQYEPEDEDESAAKLMARMRAALGGR